MSQAAYGPDEQQGASPYEHQAAEPGSATSGDLFTGSAETESVLMTLRSARKQFPGKTLEDRVVIEQLVRSLFGASLSAALGDLNEKVVSTVADTLLEDPLAMQRLKTLWDRSAEVGQ